MRVTCRQTREVGGAGSWAGKEKEKAWPTQKTKDYHKAFFDLTIVLHINIAVTILATCTTRILVASSRCRVGEVQVQV